MNKTQQFNWWYIPATLTLIIPFLYLHTWNPYSVNGPHFLGFYILLSLIVYLDMVLFRSMRQPIVVWLILVIPGIGRIIQGLYHEKPVMYLVLLVVLNIIIAGIMKLRT